MKQIYSRKKELRQECHLIRSQITPVRRREASAHADKSLRELFPSNGYILSYASKEAEFSTRDINTTLSSMGRLALPVVENKKLKIYVVNDISTETIISPLGILEPNPSLCQPITIQDLSFIIVPGLAFDKANHRLGYGGGYYDRFLSSLPTSTPKIGLGFTEQFRNDPLPITPYDIALDELFLF